MSKYIRILGIDPGSYTTGLALLVIDSKTSELVAIECELIDVYDVVKHDYVRDKLYERLFVMGKRLSSLLEYLVPDVVSIESGYIDRFRPGAYGVLSKVMYMIHNSIHQYDPMLMTEEFRPKVAKKIIQVKDMDKKATTKDALVLRKDITALIDLDRISEHEIDAISLGLVLVEKYRSFNVIL